MRPGITLCLFFLISGLTSNAQRFLETVLDPANPSFQDASLNNKVVIAGNTDTYLLSYNDVDFTQINYPIVSTVQLKFLTYNNPLTVFNAAVYFSLTRTFSGTSTQFLYRFSGSVFTRITTTGNVVSNTVALGGYVYFLIKTSGITRLYRYNGVLSEVPVTIPNAFGYKLHITEGYMYISGYAATTGTNFIIRFNGSSYLTLPYSGPGANVQDAFRVPGTSRVYFTSHERIIYYDGSTVRQVFFNTGESVNARMWRNNLYLTTGVGADPDRVATMYRLNGSSLSLVPLPAGAKIAPVGSTNPEVFRDELYVAMVFTDGTKKLMKNSGTGFLPVFDITGLVSSGVQLFLRQNNLMIQPHFPNGNTAIEYDGLTTTSIVGVTGRLMFPWINSTNCNHLWLNYYNNATGIHWAYAKEPLSCPPPGDVVIPAHFDEYERFDFNPYGVERGWCWSDIIIDWEIVPICQIPPCPDPNYEVKMIDANNGVAWSQYFNKPSSFQVPLPDVQGYRTVLTSKDNGKDLLIFESDLVEKGISSIKLNMKPKSDFFFLSATTRDKLQVPLQVTLLNANGQAIWQKTFNAPFAQQITDTATEPGQTLVFSIPDPGLKLITRLK